MWLNVQLAQVWTRPYDRVQLWIFLQNFELIYSDKDYSKFNTFFNLGLKITKSPPINLTNQGFLVIPRNCSNCLFFKFLKFYSIFNKFVMLDLNITKSPWCTPTCQQLSNNTKSMTRCSGLGDLNMTKKIKMSYLP